MHEGYSPGYSAQALAMMSGRGAVDRAAFVLGVLRSDMSVLDIGCGPGSITVGLADSVPEGHVLGVDVESTQAALGAAVGASTVDFVAASIYQLPVPEASMDVVFSHALFEHLADPAAALAEVRRVLRPGGTVALSASNWRKARLRPRTANVDAALRGHYLLRRQAGGDPFAGERLAGWARDAGFVQVRERTRFRTDLSYRELADYVATRLSGALPMSGVDGAQLASAARSATAWARGGDGDFTQCWVEVLATR